MGVKSAQVLGVSYFTAANPEKSWLWGELRKRNTVEKRENEKEKKDAVILKVAF